MTSSFPLNEFDLFGSDLLTLRLHGRPGNPNLSIDRAIQVAFQFRGDAASSFLIETRNGKAVEIA